MQEPEPSAEQLRPSLSALPSVTDGRTQVAEISLGPLIEQEDERLGRFRGIFASYRTAEAGLPTLTSAFESSVMCPAARRVQSQQPHSLVILVSMLQLDYRRRLQRRWRWDILGRLVTSTERIEHAPNPYIILFLETSNFFGAGIPISIMDDNLPENCCFQGDFPSCQHLG